MTGIFREDCWTIRWILIIAIVILAAFCFVTRNSSPSFKAPATLAGATFEDLLDAICWIESRGDANVVGDFKYFDTWEDANNWRTRNGNIADDMIVMDCGYEVNCPNLKIYIPQAIGAYQIHKIYVDDVNRILKFHKWQSVYSPALHYDYKDRWNKYLSRQMVYIYLRHYGEDKSLEDMARIHNGGPDGRKKKSTEEYWQKVKNRMAKKYFTKTGEPNGNN